MRGHCGHGRCRIHVHIVLVHLLLQILLHFCSAVLKPVIDFFYWNTQILSKTLLGTGTRLVLLVEVGFEDVMLLLGKSGLNVGATGRAIVRMLLVGHVCRSFRKTVGMSTGRLIIQVLGVPIIRIRACRRCKMVHTPRSREEARMLSAVGWGHENAVVSGR